MAVLDRGRPGVIAIGSHRALFGVVLADKAEEAGRAWVLGVVTNTLAKEIMSDRRHRRVLGNIANLIGSKRNATRGVVP